MRTVTFSDRNFQAYLTKHFVPAWDNKAPGVPVDSSFRPPENIGTNRAVQSVGGDGSVFTYILSPTGYVLHRISGYWPPEKLQAELDFAQDLYKKIRGKSLRQARQIAREAHESHLAHHQKQEANSRRRPGSEILGFKALLGDHQELIDHPLPEIEDLVKKEPRRRPSGRR